MALDPGQEYIQNKTTGDIGIVGTQDFNTKQAAGTAFRDFTPYTPPTPPATGSTRQFGGQTQVLGADGNWQAQGQTFPSSGAPTSPTTGYSRIPSSSASDQAVNTLTTPYTIDNQISDEQKLITARRAEQQAQIDAINQSFQQSISDEKAAEPGREQAQNALLAAAGIAGGGNAEKSITGTKKESEQKVNDLRAQQAQAVADALSKIDQNAIDSADAFHEQQVGDAQKALSTLNDIKQGAQQQFSTVAKASNVQWSDFQAQHPDYAQKFLDQTGYDPASAAFLWNANKAAAQQIQWNTTPTQTASGFTFTGVDPTTGKLVTQNVDVAVAGDWTISPANMYQDTMVINKKTGEAKTLAAYNAAIPENITSLTPNGTVGGECGTYVHTIVDNVPMMGDSIQSKKNFIDTQGVKAAQWKPKIGDVVIFDYKNNPNGHAAVVNQVLPNGQVQLSESNFKGDGLTSNTRVININDPSIYGAYQKGQIKGDVANGTMSPRELALEQKIATLKHTNELNESTDAMIANRRNQTVRSVITNLFGSPAKNPAAIYANSAQSLNRINPALQESLDSGTVSKQVSDLDLIDAYVQVARNGGQVTETQVDTLASGMGFGQKLSVLKQKVSGGAVLDDSTRKELAKLTKEIYDQQGNSAQKAVNEVNRELTKQGIPSQFLLDKPEDLTLSANVPDLSSSQIQTLQGQLQSGEMLVTNNQTGEVGAIPSDEFDPSIYTQVGQ